MTTWLRVSFVDAITHCVPESLLSSLCNDMAERGHAVAKQSATGGPNPEVMTEWAFDIGGPTYQDMPCEILFADDLRIFVPCDQYETIRERIRALSVRRFDGDGSYYYKIKLWCHATVLTLAHYDQIVRQMDDRRVMAKFRALEFKAAAARAAAQGGVS